MTGPELRVRRLAAGCIRQRDLARVMGCSAMWISMQEREPAALPEPFVARYLATIEALTTTREHEARIGRRVLGPVRAQLEALLATLPR